MLLPLHLGIGAKVCCLKRPAWDCVFLPKDKKVDLGPVFFFPSHLFPQPSLVQTVLLGSLQALEEHEGQKSNTLDELAALLHLGRNDLTLLQGQTSRKLATLCPGRPSGRISSMTLFRSLKSDELEMWVSFVVRACALKTAAYFGMKVSLPRWTATLTHAAMTPFAATLLGEATPNLYNVEANHPNWSQILAEAPADPPPSSRLPPPS